MMASGEGQVAIESGEREALLDRLSQHALVASGMLDQPRIAVAEHASGFVEAVALDDDGITWVVGWMREDSFFDRPIVIVDDGKHAAGFAYTLVARGDLPPGAKGFVGILKTEWRGIADRSPLFFLTDGSGQFLETLVPTPIRAKQDIATIVNALLDRAEGGARDLLRTMFERRESWSVVDNAASGDLAHVDAVAVLPGFGAFVRGWTISPNKRVARFLLKAGDQILTADERGVSDHPRHDIASVHPISDFAAEHAGFTAVFRGDIDARCFDGLVLKASWDNASASNLAIGAKLVTILGITEPLDAALGYYPSIEAEFFFPAFAHAASAGVRARSTVVHAYAVERCRSALLLVAPTVASDVFKMLDVAMRESHMLPTDWGIAILARADQSRGLVVSLFADLVRATGRPCSLFFIADPATATYAIENIAGALELDRFAFIGPDAILLRDGWQALRTVAPGLTLLEIVDPLAQHDPIVGLSAFATDRTTWSAIAADAPARIGGIALPDRLHPAPLIVPQAALALSIRNSRPFVARIDAAGAIAYA